MIKQVTVNETPFANNIKRKMDLFYKDLDYIVENKIEYSEFLNFYYSESTVPADLAYRARGFIRQKIWDITGKSPEYIEFFKFSKTKIDNKWHFYAKFDVEGWKKYIETHSI